MDHLLAPVISGIETIIATGGYGGILLLMAVESACIPLPSEVIMPFAGALTLGSIAAHAHHAPLSLAWVGLAGAAGCVIGSLVAYAVGATGGRRLALRYGRWVLLSAHDLDRADAWFDRFGPAAVFIARLLPIIRTFISFPAGISRMRIGPFVVLSFAGSLPWCYLLAWIGVAVGGHIDVLRRYFHGLDALVAITLLGLVALWIRRHRAPPAEPA